MNIIEILSNYNYWQEIPKDLGFLRTEYHNCLKTYLNSNLIKVLIGQRRVGKSYLMKQLISILINEKNVDPKNIFYLNFELEKLSFIKDTKDLNDVIKKYLSAFKPKGNIYFFFDEIQEIQNWEKTINSFFADKNIKVDIFITGSNSKLLSSELSTYITGRYISKEVYPFSYNEYLDFFKFERNKQTFLNYIQFSGIPELYNLSNDEMKNSYIHALKDSIILKDIVSRYSIKNVDFLEKIFLFLCDNIGNLFSLNSLVKKQKSLGVKTNTVSISNYIKYLENTFIIFGVDRFDVKGKKILEGEKKYYLNDLGFRNYLSSSFDYGLDKHLENFVAITLKSFGYKIYVGNIRNNEIDFVAEKQNKKLYIQVCYILSGEDVINREYGNLEKINDNWVKIVLSLDDIVLPSKNGIQHVQIWNFDEYLKKIINL